jgi:CheY-like chemotaxis protein
MASISKNWCSVQVIAQQLRRLGVHTVHVADDGLAALNFLSTTTFATNPSITTPPVPLSIILMDVEMPVMDGLGAVRRIRAAEAKGDINAHIPVIAITANARQEQVAVAMEAGMDEVVTKPFLVRELVPRMVGLVQRFAGGGGWRGMERVHWTKNKHSIERSASGSLRTLGADSDSGSVLRIENISAWALDILNRRHTVIG